MKKKKRKFKRSFKIFVAVVVALVALLCISRCRGGSESEGESLAESRMSHLNDSLTNEKSNFEGAAEMDSIIAKYLKRWEVNGAQLAVSRNDSLVYAKGYGWAEKEKNDPMRPSNILRIASVSKLITATGIMKLQEKNNEPVYDCRTVICRHYICFGTGGCKSANRNYS